MAARAGLLEMSAGSVLRLDGTDWTVAAVDTCFGRVRLDSGGAASGGWRTTATARPFRSRPRKCLPGRGGSRRRWRT
jgi:hypothetical protein